MDSASLLLVDDDEAFRERLAEALTRRGYDVRAVGRGAEAVAAAESESPELAVVDLKLGGEWGLDVVQRLLQEDENTRIVMLTAYGSIATALAAVRMGAIDFLQKPVSIDELERAFRGTTESHERRGEASMTVPSLARAEWEHINRVLTECGGNVRQAARLLGLHRRTLQRKLSKFPVSE
ncbi:MAG: response regulator [Myxococcota bacterium]